MADKNNYIVFQAYGNNEILQECAFALLTLTRLHTKEELANIEICIYTDHPEFFESFKNCSLNLNYKKLDTVLISRWRGEINFLHRAKIEMLRDFAKDKRGQILYLDTDVCFINSVTDIFKNIAAGKLYMHIMEGLIHETDNVIFKKLSKFLKRNTPLKINGKAVHIADATTMWNAGVLGFNTDHIHLLDDVLLFTDTVYQQFHKHVVEQFAFSLYFQNAGEMMTAHTHISHYWNLKELLIILNSFFNYFKNSSWDELAYYSKLIQLPEPMQQKVNFLQNRTPLAKFMKKHWHPMEPRWELLIKYL